jgi:hypothetical protein
MHTCNPNVNREPDVPSHRAKVMGFAAEQYARQCVAAGMRGRMQDLGRGGLEMRPADRYGRYARHRYGRYARECLELAQLVANDVDKALFLQMAESWRRLAERAEAQMAHHRDERDE